MLQCRFVWQARRLSLTSKQRNVLDNLRVRIFRLYRIARSTIFTISINLLLACSLANATCAIANIVTTPIFIIVSGCIAIHMSDVENSSDPFFCMHANTHPMVLAPHMAVLSSHTTRADANLAFLCIGELVAKCVFCGHTYLLALLNFLQHHPESGQFFI